MAETPLPVVPPEHPVVTVLRGFCAEHRTHYEIQVPDIREGRGVATNGKHLLAYYPDLTGGDTPLPGNPSPNFPAWGQLVAEAEACPVLARGTLAKLRALLRGPSSPITFRRVPRSCRLCVRSPEEGPEKRCYACHQLIPCERCNGTQDDPEDRRLCADPAFVDLVAPAGDRPLSITALYVRSAPAMQSTLGVRPNEDVIRIDPVLLLQGVEGLQQIEGRDAEVVVHLTHLMPSGCGLGNARLLLVTRRTRYLLMGVSVPSRSLARDAEQEAARAR